MNAIHFISPILALLITMILLPVLRKIAFHIQLVDTPNVRKVHHTQVPLVGGIGIFTATILTLLLALPFEMEVFAYKNVFIASFILLIVGVIDDRFDIRATLRLGIQLILAHFIFAQGIKIESLFGFMGIYQLDIWVQYMMTMVIITGVVNAFNLMDGIDGLAAGIAIFGFVVYIIISIIIDQWTLALLFLTFVGSLLAFLRFNLSKDQKIFMGDAGSMMLGFILVVAGIKLLQMTNHGQYNALTSFGVTSVMFVPVMDALRVFRKRAKTGKSPFSADKTHLHHLILTIGLGHKIATLTIIVMATTIMLIGYLSYDLWGLTFSIVSMLILFSILTSLLQYNLQLNQWKSRIRAMEIK